jgi:4-hydroxythreonine-4-phosphate dehydrogenase
MGEPAGIGGELTLAAWCLLRESGPAFFVIDDPDRLEALAAHLSIKCRIARIGHPHEATNCFTSALPVLPLRLVAPVTFGRPSVEHAAAVIEAIGIAVDFALNGHVSAIVTNPIQKVSLYQAGFPHPGHTEFLTALAAGEGEVAMMIAGPRLRVVPVTVHQPLREAIASLSVERIVGQAVAADAALRRDFGIAAPRLAIAGLNPHAGEGGALGTEEEDIVSPAIVRLQALGIKASGPWPPDALFTPRARANYDAAICLYHDQALIPAKALDVDAAVNVTLGLKIVRTSPDHGVALDIAGQGVADPSSLVAALQLAVDIAERRKSERHVA